MCHYKVIVYFRYLLAKCNLYLIPVREVVSDIQRTGIVFLVPRRESALLAERVESLPVDAHDAAHGDECVGVYRFDLLEHLAGLAFAHGHHDYFCRFLGIPAYTVEYRYASVHIVGYQVGYFLVLVRHDEYLRGLFVTCEQSIGNDAEYRRQNITVDYRGDILEYEVRTSYNDEVAYEYYATVTDIAVLVDYHGHYIRTSGTSSLLQHETDTDTGQGAAEDCRKQFVVGKTEKIGRHHFLQEVHYQRCDDYGVDRLYAELGAEYYDRGD